MPMPLVGNRDLTVCVGKAQLTVRGARADMLAKRSAVSILRILAHL
jgi:hypothetical protein